MRGGGLGGSSPIFKPLFDLRFELFYAFCACCGGLVVLGLLSSVAIALSPAPWRLSAVDGAASWKGFGPDAVLPILNDHRMLDSLCTSFSPDEKLSRVAALLFVQSGVSSTELRKLMETIVKNSGMMIVVSAAQSLPSETSFSLCGGRIRQLILKMDSTSKLSPSAAVHIALDVMPNSSTTFDFLWTVSSYITFQHAPTHMNLGSYLPQGAEFVRGIELPNLHLFSKGNHDISSLTAPSIHFAVWRLATLQSSGLLYTPSFSGEEAISSLCEVGLHSLTTIALLSDLYSQDPNHSVQSILIRNDGSILVNPVCSVDVLANVESFGKTIVNNWIIRTQKTSTPQVRHS
eukprot:TRINITY_DN10706_c0_g1_i6.p2 TRINITY_DN10706_c0_g1~~TRINITY_DN10706_c0_g1_i6.p2  ORF type:complete len:347 (-),score=78.16 TRINITY_DN10706_c0_g1_i6:1378-2418(-)